MGTLDAATSEAVSRVVDAANTVLERGNAFRPTFGRRLQAELEGSGLVDVRAEGRVGMWRGGTAGGRVWRLTFEQTREAMEASGLVTAADVDLMIALCEDPRFRMMSQVTMAAWGRRPT
jgi:hypothetical protein